MSKLTEEQAFDLVGKTIGQLKVKKLLGRTEKQYKNSKAVKWEYECECSCGNIRIVTRSDLQTKKVTSCYECGQKRMVRATQSKGLNGWLREEEVANNLYKWHCSCGCDEIRIMTEKEAERADCKKREAESDYKIQNCIVSEIPDGVKKNWLNIEVPHVKILGYCAKRRNSHYWVCQCDFCGKIYTANSKKLNGHLNGKFVSCGCLTGEFNKKAANDLTGRTFGKLKVIKRVENRGAHAAFLCECSCGNQVVVKGTALTRKNKPVRSCGCIVSKGELRIAKFLSKHGITFKKQAWFKECRDKNPLRFDFKIFYPNSENFFLCEFQGIQHYQPSRIRSKMTDAQVQEMYAGIVRRDNIKRSYCLNNNIELLEISYKEYFDIEKILGKKLSIPFIIEENNNLEDEDLFPETDITF